MNLVLSAYLGVRGCVRLAGEMKRVKLSNRLMALVELIDEGASVVDVGTDHGFLPVFLAQTGSVHRIFASDISAASLKRARQTAADHGLSEAITFFAGSGLVCVTPTQVDTIVIAGLGGESILSILKDAPWTLSRGIKLILQPQTKIDLLCRFLYDNGYAIMDTKSVLDRGKFYTIILALGV